MKKTLKQTAAVIAGGAALVAGTALTSGSLLSSAAATAATDVSETPLLPQKITLQALQGIPDYGQWVDFAPYSGRPDQVTVESLTPDTCVVKPGSSMTHLVGVGTCWEMFSLPARPGYEAAPTLTAYFQVNPAPLTVHLHDATRASDEPNPTWDISYTGLTNGDTAAAIRGVTVMDAPAAVGTGQTPADPGVYTVHARGANNPNYRYTYESATLQINPVVSMDGSALDIPSLKIDDTWLAAHGRWVLPYNSSHHYEFAPYFQSPEGFYLTRDLPHDGPVTSNQVITYKTMDEVVAGQTANQAVRDELAGAWYDVLHPLLPDSQEADLHAFATNVRAVVHFGYLSSDGADRIIAWAQTFFTDIGYSGDI